MEWKWEKEIFGIGWSKTVVEKAEAEKKISGLEADIEMMDKEAMELFEQITNLEVKIATMNRVMTLAGEGHQAKMLEMQNQVNLSERAKLDWQVACRDKDAQIAQLQGELDTIGQKHDEEIRELKGQYQEQIDTLKACLELERQKP